MGGKVDAVFALRDGRCDPWICGMLGGRNAKQQAPMADRPVSWFANWLGKQVDMVDSQFSEDGDGSNTRMGMGRAQYHRIHQLGRRTSSAKPPRPGTRRTSLSAARDSTGRSTDDPESWNREPAAVRWTLPHMTRLGRDLPTGHPVSGYWYEWDSRSPSALPREYPRPCSHPARNEPDRRG
jgi:hypothetical protein